VSVPGTGGAGAVLKPPGGRRGEARCPTLPSPTGGRKQWPGSPAEAERHASATLYQRCRDTQPRAALPGVPCGWKRRGRAGAAPGGGPAGGGARGRWGARSRAGPLSALRRGAPEGATAPRWGRVKRCGEAWPPAGGAGGRSRGGGSTRPFVFPIRSAQASLASLHPPYATCWPRSAACRASARPGPAPAVHPTASRGFFPGTRQRACPPRLGKTAAPARRTAAASAA
jgi:hypothetical protein